MLPFTLDVSFVNTFQNNLELGLQQFGSVLSDTVTHRTQASEYEYWDRVGAIATDDVDTEAMANVRHGDTQYQELAITRRRVRTTEDYWATLVKEEDRLRSGLKDFNSPFIASALSLLGRKTDKKIISGLNGTTYTGTNGATAETFDTANQRIAVNAKLGFPSGSGDNTNMTVDKLRFGRQKLLHAHAIMPGEMVTLVWTASQMMSLLESTVVGSIDYNAVKPLVDGQVNTFMGYQFKLYEELPLLSGTTRKCYAYAKSAVILSTMVPLHTRVDIMPNKNYETQIWVGQSNGTARTYNEKIIEFLCDEAA